MVLKKNAALIPQYYHPDFLIYTNGITIGYQEFLDSHIQYYATAIQYQVEYDEETWVAENNKVAVKMYITVKKPDQPARKIEVMLIAEYRENKIFRLWELTFPDWSQMPAFKDV